MIADGERIEVVILAVSESLGVVAKEGGRN